jgi:transposase
MLVYYMFCKLMQIRSVEKISMTASRSASGYIAVTITNHYRSRKVN